MEPLVVLHFVLGTHPCFPSSCPASWLGGIQCPLNYFTMAKDLNHMAFPQGKHSLQTTDSLWCLFLWGTLARVSLPRGEGTLCVVRWTRRCSLSISKVSAERVSSIYKLATRLHFVPASKQIIFLMDSSNKGPRH